ncbi:MAG TPA: recombination mediator RecR [Bacteroidales bacterium]|nr:recombination mediator RecR [Bacteroidales bacterium]
MSIQNFSSKLLESAVDEFAKLPGIGRKTALRLVLYLLNQEKEEVNHFGETIIKLRNEIKHCKSCNTISDTDVCSICSDKKRDHSTICVVENARDLMAIENTHQYKGIYHVLGGIISPMDGIGPNDLNIESLAQKIEEGTAHEIILALSTTMEGDTTNYFLYKKFKNYPVKITTIARGVSIGDDLEYADEITLGRSIVKRTLFETSV